MGIDAVNGISLFRPVVAAGSVEGINGGARKIARAGGNPFEVGNLTFGSSGTGEVISDYGTSGASAAAYKGLSRNPNDTVGATFDTNRLGFYGF